MQGPDFIAIAAVITLGYTIWRNHWYNPQGVTKKNPIRMRMNPKYDSPEAIGCKIRDLTVIAPDTAKIGLETVGGHRFTETRNRLELDCDIFQVMAGNDPPRIWVKSRRAVPDTTLIPVTGVVDNVVKEPGPFKCECGREFEKRSALVGHKRHCKFGKEDEGDTAQA